MYFSSFIVMPGIFGDHLVSQVNMLGNQKLPIQVGSTSIASSMKYFGLFRSFLSKLHSIYQADHIDEFHLFTCSSVVHWTSSVLPQIEQHLLLLKILFCNNYGGYYRVVINFFSFHILVKDQLFIVLNKLVQKWFHRMFSK